MHSPDALPIIAIVGRPNVGKSTLFNRLLGERKALVHDRAGVTRDRQYGITDLWGDRELMLIDTGGLEAHPDDDLFRTVRRQALAAVEEADVVLFVLDARAGLTPADSEVARELRAAHDRVIVVANKIDVDHRSNDALELYELGFERVFPVSAEHARGMGDLMDAALEMLPVSEAAPAEEDDSVIRIAILGRPNVGKSTLVNRILGEERQVVSDMPGTTMDAIDTPMVHEGQRFVIVDTAGIRRKARIDDELEGFAVSRSIRTIERCHVTIVLLEGAEGVTEQDARLVHLVEERGRALILVVNKWDLVRQDPERGIADLEYEMDRRLPHARWAPVLYISALTGKGIHRILPLVLEVYAEFNKRVSTSDCNRLLEDAMNTHSVPQRASKQVKLNFMTQVRVRPPTFTIWTNTPDGVDDSYKRFLVNKLRERWGFMGTPIRLQFRRKKRAREEEEEAEAPE